MTAVLDVLKFLLGAVILLLSAIDADAQPVVALIALVLMGVLTVEQVQRWGGRG